MPLVAVVLVLGVTWFFLRLEGRRPADLGVRLDAARLRQFVPGLGVGTAVFVSLAGALGSSASSRGRPTRSVRHCSSPARPIGSSPCCSRAALRTGSIALPAGLHLAGNRIQWQLFTSAGDTTPMGLWRPAVAAEYTDASSRIVQVGYAVTMAAAPAGFLLVTRRRHRNPAGAEHTQRSDTEMTIR